MVLVDMVFLAIQENEHSDPAVRVIISCTVLIMSAHSCVRDLKPSMALLERCRLKLHFHQRLQHSCLPYWKQPLVKLNSSISYCSPCTPFRSLTFFFTRNACTRKREEMLKKFRTKFLVISNLHSQSVSQSVVRHLNTMKYTVCQFMECRIPLDTCLVRF